MLSVLVTLPPNIISSSAGLLDTALDLFPSEVRDAIPNEAEQLLDLVDSGTVYQAFPGEVNNVTVEGDLANLVLLFGERNEVTVGRFGIPPALPPVGKQQELLDMLIPDFTLGLNLGGEAGPVVVMVQGAGEGHISITGKQIREFIKQHFDMGDSRSIVFNGTALLDLLPDIGNLAGIVDNILDFDIKDILPTIDIEPIVDIDLPFGLPNIQIPPNMSRSISDFIAQAGVPTSLRDLVDLFPGPVSGAIGIVTGLVDFLKGDLISDSIFISTLDGPDNISFEKLTGIPVQVYAGAGDDTIHAGGGVALLESLIDPFDILDLNLFDNDPAKIELFGGGGTDTFIVTRRFHSNDFNIDGGTGNDQLLVQGTDQADIIVIEADSNGRLTKIRYLVPDPNGNVATDEVQVVTLPPNTDGGDFTLTFQSSSGVTETTGPIIFSADGSAVETALEALSLINPADVSVSGPSAGPWTVMFAGGLGESNQRPLRGDGSGLSQTGGAMDVQQVQEGDPGTGVNHVKKIALPDFITGGTFTLTSPPVTTEPIGYYASAANVQAALEVLPTFDPGDISVSGRPGGPWFVEFVGDLALTNAVPTITADGANLTGGITSELTATDGVPLETTVTLPGPQPGQPLGGTFTLSVGAHTTAPLPFNASATQVRDALENLPNANNVSVSGPFGGPWSVTLSGSGAASGVSGDPSQLTGGVALNVTDTTSGFSVNERQRVALNNVTGGTFKLLVDNGTISRWSDAIPYNATVDEVQAAVENLGSVGGPNNLIVSGNTGGPWTFEFTGDLSGVNMPWIAVDMSGLSGIGVSSTLTTLAQGQAGVNETQDITLSPSALGGDFTLTFKGETTSPIAFAASPAQLQSVLETLGEIDPGDIDVTGTPGNWSVEFVGLESAVNQPAMTGAPSNLIGGFPTNGSVQVVQNQAPSNEFQTITFDHPAAGGTFLLGFGGELTDPPLNHDATAAQVDSALEQLASVGANNVIVTGSPGNYSVQFVGDLAAADVPDLFVRTSKLTRNEPVVVEVETEASLTNEIQRVRLPLQVTSGTFTLTFQSMTVEETVEGGDGSNEQQTIKLPAGTTGGNFRLEFDGVKTGNISSNAGAGDVESALRGLSSIAGANVSVTQPTAGTWVVEFTGTLADTDVPLIRADGENLTGPFTTAAIPYDASPAQVETALENLASLGGSLADNVQVTGLELDVEQTIRGRTAVNEVQSIALPSHVTGGTFDLAYDGETATGIPFGATPGQLETALEGLSNIGDVAVTGNPGGPWSVVFKGTLAETDVPLMSGNTFNLNFEGGPWTVEFINDFTGKALALMTVDATDLVTSGLGDPTVGTTTQGGDGQPILISTKQFNTFTDVEHLRIELMNGDDRVIFEGIPEFTQGIFVDGGDGGDSLELIPTSSSPEFGYVTTYSTIDVDGQGFRFSSVSGLIFDAGRSQASASVWGDFAGNEFQFRGTGPRSATITSDSLPKVMMRDFGDDSSVAMYGGEGDDLISVQPNGVTEFASITINGGGPLGADAVRFEGTTGNDSFVYTPDQFSVEAGSVEMDSTTLDFSGVGNVSFVGSEGTDSLLVNEPVAGSNDTILFNPQVGNDGSFQFTSQSGGPGTAMVYPVAAFQSIENRTFDTGTGTDTLSIASDDLPGVNSTASVVGGNGITTAAFGDQSTTFAHNVDDRDLITLEIGTVVDDVTVTPGVGIEVAINTGLGLDLLTYLAQGGAVVVRVEDNAIAQLGLGDVTFTSAENVSLQGGGALTINGTPLDDRFTYRPLGAEAGAVRLDNHPTAYAFGQFTGQFSIVGAAADADVVVVEGTGSADVITVDGPASTVSLTDSVGTARKPVVLGGTVERAVVESGSGNDLIAVLPSAALPVEVDGGPANAAGDRLIVRDEGPGDVVRHHQGPDQRSGSIFVGPFAPVAYRAIERVDILPIDPLTGGTGNDQAGQIVVFYADQYEQNDTFLNPAELPDLGESTYKPNIDPGGLTDPFGLGFDVPGDEDWYRFTAPKIGSYRLEVLFDPIAGLPGGGDLDIELYDEDSALVVAGSPWTSGNLFGEEVTFEVDNDQEVYLRVRGAAPESINVYDVELVEVDLVGPRVTNVAITGEPDFNLFNRKPSASGAGPGGIRPTPLVHSITVSLEDLIVRPPGAQGFVYPTLDLATAQAVGHYRVEGDANGVIPIKEVIPTNDPPVVGTIPTGTIELVFFEPLPDDRLTLTISEQVLDPAENRLDGESNAVEPHDHPTFPSGDNRAGGDFVARFTVDSRPEIGVWSAGSVYVDTNGNFYFDPENLDDTNEDLVYVLGFTTDYVFAGNFAQGGNNADGFDKLAAYGFDTAGDARWLIDTDNDGVPNIGKVDHARLIGYPVAGNFDGNALNGDEIGLYEAGTSTWYLDADRSWTLGTPGDIVIAFPGMQGGFPIAGDFDGDDLDDLAVFNGVDADTPEARFTFALQTFGWVPGQPLRTLSTGFESFIGVRERPVAADMDMDGIDDVGLWVPDRSGAVPGEAGEWYFLISNDHDDNGQFARIFGQVNTLDHEFSPDPLGNDLFAQFGDEFAVPVVGNFDPPLAGEDVAQGHAVLGLLGTREDDVLEFTAGSTPGSWTVTLNGVPQDDVSGDTITLDFRGRGGNDTVTLTASGGADRAELWPGHGTLVGEGYSVAVANVELVTVNGGGGTDVAILRDNPTGKDTFQADPDVATLSGDGYSNQVASFRYVHAFSTSGDSDVAFLHDDPNGADKFKASPTEARLFGAHHYSRALSFRNVYAYGTPGNNDAAVLSDNPNGKDTFRSDPDVATLSGNGYANQAASFRYVAAVSTPGNDDAAYLHDDPDGDDTFKAWPDEARLFGADHSNRALSFRNVYAYGTPGNNDVAVLIDSSRNDTFEAWPEMARLFGPGYSNQVESFRYTHGWSIAGGTDEAWLYGSDARDVFVANSRFSKLRGTDFYNRAVSFEQVYAYGGAGRDVAVLYDAVLETGITDPPPSAAAVAWLHEFARLRLRSTEPDSDQTVVKAVDQVFTAYWE